MSAVSAEPRLRVAVEATALLGAKTGVGVMTEAVLGRLAAIDDLDVTAVVVSWRGRRRVAELVPDGVITRDFAFPARLAHQLWSRFDRPGLRGFDVVHGPNFVAPPAREGVELITIHDFGPWHFGQLVTHHARAYPRLVARAVDRGAHVHTVSEFVAGEARELLGLAPERVHPIANGFDPGAAGDPAGATALVGDAPYVLALGTIEPRKDLPTLVAAMPAVWAAVPDLRLVVAGADGWGTDDFDDAVGRLSGPGRAKVIRLGYVSDRQRVDLLAGASCLAYASRYEGFGLPPLEAMAQGTPVIASTAGALPETCGDAARYVEVGDGDAVAAAIIDLATDAGQAAALIAAGRARIERYSWDATTVELAALYRQLARQHAQRAEPGRR